MDRLVHVLAGLLARVAGLLGEGRRDWVHALLAETGEMSGWPARLAWLGGGLWLLARAAMRKTVQVLAFLAGAVALTRIGWPGPFSFSTVPKAWAAVPYLGFSTVTATSGITRLPTLRMLTRKLVCSASR